MSDLSLPPPFWFVLDVEAVGLQGDAYAFGFVVIDNDGAEHAAGGAVLGEHGYDFLRGNEAGHAFIAQYGALWRNPVEMMVVDAQEGILALFTRLWTLWQKKGAVLVADHPFPVETRFLDGLTRHGVAMPYPLIDVASVRLAAGFDPIGTEPRLRNEEPAHNPLADARQSARLLLEALAACRAKAAT